MNWRYKTHTFQWNIITALIWKGLCFNIYMSAEVCGSFPLLWIIMHFAEHQRTHPVSGVINQILSPICNHLHLRYLLYVCLAVWSCMSKSVGVCVCVCMSHLHHLECISVCRSMLQHRRGPLKTHRHIPTSASGCNSHMHACTAHTHVQVCVFVNNCNHSLHLTPVFWLDTCRYVYMYVCVCLCCWGRNPSFQNHKRH